MFITCDLFYDCSINKRVQSSAILTDKKLKNLF